MTKPFNFDVKPLDILEYRGIRAMVISVKDHMYKLMFEAYDFGQVEIKNYSAMALYKYNVVG